MHMIRLIGPVIALTMPMAGGCVIANSKTETRSHALANFDGVTATSGIDVVLVQGPFSVTSAAPEGNLDRIKIEQLGGELKLSREFSMSWGLEPRYVVTVTAPAIRWINVSGGADLMASALDVETLALDASGGGDIEITDLKVATLNVSVSGGGDIDASGVCQAVTINAASGGDFDGEKLACASATVTAGSGGDVDIRASQSATGKAFGGGDIRFIGTPATFNNEASSGGDISLEAP